MPINEALPTPGRTQLSATEFAVFFNDLIVAATTSGRGAVTPLDLLKEYGLEIDLPPKVAARLALALKLDLSGRQSVAECGACGVCGACGLCGGANAGSAAVAIAAVAALA